MTGPEGNAPRWDIADLRQRPELHEVLRARVHAPLKPRPDNVTPPTRTPWGGRRIFREIKAGLPSIPRPPDDPIVGESWELSDDPAFPSRIALPEVEGAPEVALGALLDLFPEEILGAETAQRTGGRLPLLVKLLDARDDLSVQVHPPAGYPGLAPGESSKSEAWVVLAHDAGAGLFLGLAEGVDRDRLAAALKRGDDIGALLQFVEVAEGDVFVIPPGTVHAIGRGCTLIEPQVFAPPASGATYRLWDWGRRYDDAGRQDPAGKPRPLHVEDALSVLDETLPTGAAGVAARRGEPCPLDTEGPGERLALVSTEGFWLHRLSAKGGASVPLTTDGSFFAMTCTHGWASVAAGGTAHALRRGETLLVPAAAGKVVFLPMEPTTVYLSGVR